MYYANTIPHFQMSYGNLTGLRSVDRECSVGFKCEDKSMTGLAELEIVAERDGCKLGEHFSLSKNQSGEQTTQYKRGF